MTTISGTELQARPADRLLRNTLKVDAIACGLTGLGFLGTPMVFDLPRGFAIPTGIFLILFAIGVWRAGSQKRISPPAVGTIIVLNIAWVAATIMVLAARLLPLPPLGVGFAIVQAIAVAALAELEFIGLRKATRAS